MAQVAFCLVFSRILTREHEISGVAVVKVVLRRKSIRPSASDAWRSAVAPLAPSMAELSIYGCRKPDDGETASPASPLTQ